MGAKIATSTSMYMLLFENDTIVGRGGRYIGSSNIVEVEMVLCYRRGRV